jgi:hypothetical protein
MATNNRELSLFFVIATACVSNAALAAVCPISECDYGDPQYRATYEKYKVLSDVYQRCIDPIVNSYLSAVDRLAILYPRFGIAHRAMQDEIRAAEAAQNAYGSAKEAANNAAQAAFAAAARAYEAAHPAATVLEVQAHAYADPSYVTAQAVAKAVNDPNNPADDASAEAEQNRINEAHQRFEDRILRTAEPDALELYNLYHLKLRQQIDRCGPIPTPPQAPRK